jgi:hypothetical protein
MARFKLVFFFCGVDCGAAVWPVVWTSRAQPSRSAAAESVSVCSSLFIDEFSFAWGR